MTDKNQSAFPVVKTEHEKGVNDWGRVSSTGGLSIREYFSGLAMQGMLASMNGYDGSDNWQQHLAEDSVKQADALIEALNKK